MINSVSPVSFKSGTVKSPQERLSDPGRYSPLPENNSVPKKKGGLGKALLKLAAAVVVIGGALWAGKHYNWFSKLAEKDNAILRKAGEYLETAGKWVDEEIVQNCSKLIGTVKARFLKVEKGA